MYVRTPFGVDGTYHVQNPKGLRSIWSWILAHNRGVVLGISIACKSIMKGSFCSCHPGAKDHPLPGAIWQRTALPPGQRRRRCAPLLAARRQG